MPELLCSVSAVSADIRLSLIHICAPWEDIYKDLDHSDTHAGAGGDRCGG